LPIAVNLCVERYLDRPALTPPTLDALVSAVTALPAQVGGGLDPGRVDGAHLYDAACRHCHEDGPAGSVLIRRWPRRQLVDVIRGQDRPAHPATHMPAFTTATLSDAALDALVEFIADAPTRAR
jgi:mono/diheme cytochrome c family protein